MDNFLDPIASPNLPQDDPLRAWVEQIQSDPDLPKLMATDPEAAIKRMSEMGIPPPPVMNYTDGLSTENSPTQTIGGRNPPLPTQTVGGASPQTPYPAAGDPMTAGQRNRSIVERARDIFRLDPDAYNNWRKDTPLPSLSSSAAAAPAPAPQVAPVAPAAPSIATVDAGGLLDPEPNPSAGAPLLPRARPPEAGPPAQKKEPENFGDALAGFGKSLQGVKPVAPPAPQKVSTPGAPSHPAIQAPQLSALLSLVGQPASPIQMTLGRLLASGKA